MLVLSHISLTDFKQLGKNLEFIAASPNDPSPPLFREKTAALQFVASPSQTPVSPVAPPLTSCTSNQSCTVDGEVQVLVHSPLQPAPFNRQHTVLASPHVTVSSVCDVTRSGHALPTYSQHFLQQAASNSATLQTQVSPSVASFTVNVQLS